MTIQDKWLPRSIECLRGYTFNSFTHDLVAGITVGLVALPLAMAFAIASGVPPQAGLYTAVVAGFLISALGGSRTQIGGPTGAFVVIVGGIVAKFGIAGLCTGRHHGRSPAPHHGLYRPRLGSQVHSTASHHRLHQWNRPPDRLHSDQRFSRSHNCLCSERIL